jgi:hypothetical protein
MTHPENERTVREQFAVVKLEVRMVQSRSKEVMLHGQRKKSCTQISDHLIIKETCMNSSQLQVRIQARKWKRLIPQSEHKYLEKSA